MPWLTWRNKNAVVVMEKQKGPRLVWRNKEKSGGYRKIKRTTVEIEKQIEPRWTWRNKKDSGGHGETKRTPVDTEKHKGQRGVWRNKKDNSGYRKTKDSGGYGETKRTPMNTEKHKGQRGVWRNKKDRVRIWRNNSKRPRWVWRKNNWPQYIEKDIKGRGGRRQTQTVTADVAKKKKKGRRTSREIQRPAKMDRNNTPCRLQPVHQQTGCHLVNIDGRHTSRSPHCFSANNPPSIFFSSTLFLFFTFYSLGSLGAGGRMGGWGGGRVRMCVE